MIVIRNRERQVPETRRACTCSRPQNWPDSPKSRSDDRQTDQEQPNAVERQAIEGRAKLAIAAVRLPEEAPRAIGQGRGQIHDCDSESRKASARDEEGLHLLTAAKLPE